MKDKQEKKIYNEIINQAAQNALQLGKKAAAGVQVGVINVVEKAKDDSVQKKLKKLNPLFPDQYFSDKFPLPNIIIIVDDAKRRDIELCKGAIGWRNSDTGTEILYMYDEFVPQSGIKFIPAPSCDSAYCVDNFDRTKFIKADYVFSKAQEERLAELKNIAYCLGAKKCTIEISEHVADAKKRNLGYKNKAKVKGIGSEESFERTENESNNIHISGRDVIEFEGSENVLVPKLKWFANDDGILRLIDMRLKAGNKIKSEHLTITGASCSTMSKDMAYSVDCSMKEIVGAGTQLNLKDQADKESRSVLKYIVEF